MLLYTYYSYILITAYLEEMIKINLSHKVYTVDVNRCPIESRVLPLEKGLLTVKNISRRASASRASL